MPATKTRSSLEQMIQRQVIDKGIKDERVIDALRSTPREKFFPAGREADAFADRASPIGHGQTISQPYIVALMTQTLDIRSSDRVLEVGTGSGYQTVLLSKLAKEVWSIERIKPLLDEAFERVLMLGSKNVHFRNGDGTLGWPEAAPFDRVLIAAGAPELPHDLLVSQLVDGGTAVLPVGPDESQMLVKVTRRGQELQQENVCAVRFVKLIGKSGWQVEAS